jgi:hypothetical protein
MKRDEEPYWKRKFTTEQRTAAARSGAAMPDGSFPIKNKDDLENAMRAIGRAKDPGRAREHIRERARQLGLTGDLSDSFKRNNMNKFSEMFAKVFGGASNDVVIDKALDGLGESVASIFADDNVNKAEALGETFAQFGDHLKETLTAGSAVVKTSEKGSDMDIAILRKALGLADTATEAEVSAAIATLKIKGGDKNPDKVKDNEYDDEEEDTDPKLKAAKKSVELPEEIKKALADADDLKKRFVAMEEREELHKLEKRASELGLPVAEAATIQKAYKGDKAAVDKLLEVIKQANATARTAGVFKEFGTSHGSGTDGSPMEELNTLAKKLAEKDPSLSFAKAFAKVYEDPANIEIVRRERGQNRPSAA